MAGDRFVFAHLADAHVGAWPRAPAVRAALRRSVLRALKVVQERGAEFLLVSGDLFHTPVPDPTEVAPVAAALKRLVDAGRRIYVIYGSHDYVAHRTSWLDVLAEAGVFVKVAPEAVRTEGTRWTLPYQVDPPTGARIAGISGRSHGLDREYFRAMDAEAFRAEPGLKIFQFHAAVEEYLPEFLRPHIKGIRRDDLPAGCDYYAGGHIHYTYEGEGPTGGLLINPGAVFGTSRTDLEHAVAGHTHQGIVLVTVDRGRLAREFVDTAPREAIRLVDVDVTGQSADAARAEVARRLAAAAAPGALVFPKVHGTLADGSVAGLSLSSAGRAAGGDAAAVTWDVTDLGSATPATPTSTDEVDIEGRGIRALLEATRADQPWIAGPDGERIVRELIRELGLPRADGESKVDYQSARRTAARRVLGLGAEAAD
ncbi:MAG TPA: DNA repair exonuclease [Thermoplasmata archaeon]|nr:DNA repair exonuclease [Thermoplasmata archaeon]